jgi:hypothetical protein
MQLRMLGLTREDVAADPSMTCAVWPCCWQSVEVFARMSTQWRVGVAGPVGLDYAALPVVTRACGVPAGKRSAVFDDLQVMEREALAVLREK